MVSFDILLNLLWALLTAGAVVCHLLAAREVRAKHVLAVLLAAVSLFPCISASDDLARLRDLNAPLGAGVRLRPTGAQQLGAQLEDLDHYQIQIAFLFLLALLVVLLIRTEVSAWAAFLAGSVSERSPPALS